MLVFILLGLCLSLWSIPATHSMAKEKENEKLKVMIRDMDWRKVLVREGGVWETKDNLLFEIPWEEIEMDSCQITIFCTGEKGRVKSFNLQCQRKY